MCTIKPVEDHLMKAIKLRILANEPKCMCVIFTL